MNFTGVDRPYEAPEIPEIYINSTKRTAGEAAEKTSYIFFERLIKNNLFSDL